jgi:dTDP-glucose 4,6-dehydratase
MRILITGGYGFIGSNLIRSLLDSAKAESDMEISYLVNLDKMTYAANPENLADLVRDPRHIPVQGDIGDGALVSGLFANHDFDAVIHLAAESHVDRSIDDPESFVMTNVVGTYRLLEAARLHHRRRSEVGKTFRFLHVSTDEVYGSLLPEDPAFSETTAYAPNSPYSASKAASDHLARAYFHTYGLPVITTNCSNNYGPRQFPEKLIPLMISKIRRGETLPVYGDGQQVRDWLYVEDHCRALARVLAKGRAGEVYNIGGRNELTNLSVVTTLIHLVNERLPEPERRPPSERIRHVTDRPGHDRRYAIDSTKIEQELGWHPVEDPESGFRKTVAWYFENQGWIGRILSGTYRGERLGSGTA